MNETYEKEINLKWLLYRVLCAWKTIVVFSVVIALALGIGSAGLKAVKYLDKEFMENERLDFERTHASWVAQKENYRISLENLQEAKRRQVEYNDKSIMMDIDPMKKTVASFELYVKYDYKIDPSLSLQPIDLSDRILRSYATYMTNGEMYHYIMAGLDYEIELRYFTEIFSVSVDYNNNFINLSVVHTNAEECEKILNLAKKGIESRTQQIAKDIDEHSIILSNQTSYESIDLGLKDSQEANLQVVTNIDVSIQQLNDTIRKWEDGIVKLEDGQDEDDVLTGIEPVFEYDPIEILKKSIKKAVIGGVAAGALLVLIQVLIAIVSPKLLDSNDIKNRFGLRIIGMLPAEEKKGKLAGVTLMFSRLCGITLKSDEYKSLAKMIGASIRSDITSRGSLDGKTIAFAGTVSAEDIKNAVSAMDIGGYKLLCAPNLLTDSLSVDKVAHADYVVVVEKQEETLIADVERELESLKAWNKTILGAVVINVDAI